MQIALVVPDFLSGTSFLQQPLDFLYSAKLLENKGYSVKVTDCRINHLSFKHLTDKLQGSDLIVVTTTPCDQVQNYFLDYRYSYAVQTINHIKAHFTNIPVVVCGAHSSIRPDLVLKEANCDILIKGEIYTTLLLLADAVKRKDSLSSVPNIIYKTKDGVKETEVDANLYHPTIPDDVFPAYEKVNMSAYFGDYYENNVPLRKRHRVVMQGGRGCPFSCTFCHNFYGKHIKRRSVEAVIHEMEICKQTYDTKDIFFLDEVFTLDRKWVLELCNEMQRRSLSFDISAQTRIDCLDSEMLQQMSKAGFKNLWIGVESANDHILELSHKGTQIDDINHSIDMIGAAKIDPYAFFMLGMPGENIDTLNETLRQIYNYKVPYTRSIMICTPRYGTPYYQLALKQYPNLGEHWFNLNAVKGLIANEMTPSLLQKAKAILKSRDFIYQPQCPQI